MTHHISKTLHHFHGSNSYHPDIYVHVYILPLEFTKTRDTLCYLLHTHCNLCAKYTLQEQKLLFYSSEVIKNLIFENNESYFVIERRAPFRSRQARVSGGDPLMGRIIIQSENVSSQDIYRCHQSLYGFWHTYMDFNHRIVEIITGQIPLFFTCRLFHILLKCSSHRLFSRN